MKNRRNDSPVAVADRETSYGDARLDVTQLQKMTMQELLDLNIGAVVQLDQPANANVEVFVNHKLVARGEVVVAEDNFGIRIKEIIAKS